MLIFKEKFDVEIYKLRVDAKSLEISQMLSRPIGKCK
jgi:hypothetical protein